MLVLVCTAKYGKNIHQLLLLCRWIYLFNTYSGWMRGVNAQMNVFSNNIKNDWKKIAHLLPSVIFLISFYLLQYLLACFDVYLVYQMKNHHFLFYIFYSIQYINIFITTVKIKRWQNFKKANDTPWNTRKYENLSQVVIHNHNSKRQNMILQRMDKNANKSWTQKKAYIS